MTKTYSFIGRKIFGPLFRCTSRPHIEQQRDLFNTTLKCNFAKCAPLAMLRTQVQRSSNTKAIGVVLAADKLHNINGFKLHSTKLLLIRHSYQKVEDPELYQSHCSCQYATYSNAFLLWMKSMPLPSSWLIIEIFFKIEHQSFGLGRGIDINVFNF